MLVTSWLQILNESPSSVLPMQGTVQAVHSGSLTPPPLSLYRRHLRPGSGKVQCAYERDREMNCVWGGRRGGNGSLSITLLRHWGNLIPANGLCAQRSTQHFLYVWHLKSYTWQKCNLLNAMHVQLVIACLFLISQLYSR